MSALVAVWLVVIVGPDGSSVKILDINPESRGAEKALSHQRLVEPEPSRSIGSDFCLSVDIHTSLTGTGR